MDPREPNQRLRRALHDLANATRKEHQEITQFADRIGELGFAVAGLEQSCRKYRATLGALNTSKLKRRSLRLAQIMATIET